MKPRESTAQPSDIRRMDAAALSDFVASHLLGLTEAEALLVLSNRNCTSQICQSIAENQKLTSYYTVRARLVSHRATPQAQALKFVRHLYWADLLRFSTNVLIPAAVRRSIDNLLAGRLGQLTLGQRISSAKSCSTELIRLIMYDHNPRVFQALLMNPRLREDDLVVLIASERASAEQLHMISADRKWTFRYSIRRSLVLNPTTPRAIAASQLRHLRPSDLKLLAKNPQTSTYLKRCIERLEGPTGAEIEA